MNSNKEAKYFPILEFFLVTFIFNCKFRETGNTRQSQARGKFTLWVLTGWLQNPEFMAPMSRVGSSIWNDEGWGEVGSFMGSDVLWQIQAIVSLIGLGAPERGMD